MKIIIDNKNVQIDLQGITNLEDALVRIMNESIPEDRTISEVSLDGKTYSEGYPHQAMEVLLDTIGEIKIRTLALQDIVSNIGEKGPAIIEGIVKGIEKSADMFRISDEAEANEYYMNVIDTLKNFFEFIESMKSSFNLDFSSVYFRENTIEHQLNQMSNIMDEIIRNQEEADWILTADLLEYELVPLIRNWSEIISMLMGREPVK